MQLVQSYGLAFVRIATFVFCVPPFFGRLVPVRFRLGLITLLTIVAVPGVGESDQVGNIPILVLQEAIVGFAMGFSTSLLLATFQMAGSLIGRLAGGSLTLASNGTDGSPITAMYYGVATTLLFVSGAHRIVIDGLLRTFKELPSGVEWTLHDTTGFLGTLMTTSFEFSLRVAGPVVVVILAASVTTAIVARFVRSFSFFGVGMSVNAMLLVGAMIISCAILPSIFALHFESALEITARFLDSILT